MNNETTYWATEEDMLARMHGSIGADWVEVRIIGRQYAADDQLQRKYLLVETVDGSKRFTTNENHIFTKTQESKS